MSGPCPTEPVALGFDHFAVGPGRPVLVDYGEAEYLASCGGALGLYDYAHVGLPEACDGVDDAELVPLFCKLKSRAVVLWPEPDDTGNRRALHHAAMLAEAGATAVGLVETPDEIAPNEVRGYVDAALRAALSRALPARAVVPWGEPLDAGAMFAALRNLLARTLAEPATTLDAIALWCLHTWLVRDETSSPFDVSPRLVFQAGDARADHARALRILAWLTPSPVIVSRALAAHLLPMIEADRPTLLLDDVGGGMLYRRDMRTLIAAGASRDSTFLSARTKRNPAGRSSCFAPTAMATMGSLAEDARLRAIVVPMAPVPAGVARGRLTLSRPPDEVPALRAQMQAFAAEVACALPDAEVALPRNLCTAARENWAPLIALARCIGARVGARAVEAAEALSDAAPPPSSNLALLADIREIFGVDGQARIPTAKMIDKLTDDAERPWGSSRRGRKIDARELAERLGRFGVRPTVLRTPEGALARGYMGEALLDAYARYLNDAEAAQMLPPTVHA